MPTRPLRFCMITTFYPPWSFGGDGTYVQGLALELARRGHRVEVVHCADSYRRDVAARASADGGHQNVTVHTLRSPFGLLSPILTHQFGRPMLKARRLRAILRERYDVIHFHNVSLVGGPGVLSYGGGIKLYTLHDYWLVCPTHALFRFNRKPCARPSFCGLCSLSYGRPPQWWRYSGLTERAAAHIDAFIAPSLTSQRKHEQLGLRGRIVHLPNFSPLHDGDAGGAQPDTGVRHDRPGNVPYFLYVGRLELLKGVHTIVPVFREYDRAELWVAGSGTEEAALRRLAGGSPRIRFLGHVPTASLAPLYRQAVALLYPPVNHQLGIAPPSAGRGAPLVVMEAFSQRTPVIARRGGSIPAILEGCGGGLVYSTDAELVTLLDRLLENPLEREALGERGHEAYRQQWTATAHVREYLNLIDEIASTRGRA